MPAYKILNDSGNVDYPNQNVMFQSKYFMSNIESKQRIKRLKENINYNTVKYDSTLYDRISGASATVAAIAIWFPGVGTGIAGISVCIGAYFQVDKVRLNDVAKRVTTYNKKMSNQKIALIGISDLVFNEKHTNSDLNLPNINIKRIYNIIKNN